MLQPSRIKYRKVQKGNFKGKAHAGTTVAFGDFGLQAQETIWLTARQIEAARRAMTRHVKRGGKILVCGATAGFDPKEDLRYVWSFEIQIIGSNSFYDENLKALMDLIQEGKIKPVIDEVLPLQKASEGLKLIENREVFGKVVICP